jgi:hypothetical protein
MTGKHYNWHKSWRWQGQRLVHDSGLAFEVDEVLGICTCEDVLEAFQAFESARGVPLHDMHSRILRLTKEAGWFYECNPNPNA